MGRNDAIRDFKKSLGLVLVFIGMQFNTAVKNVIPGINFSMVIMLLSAILLLDLKGFFRIEISKKMLILMMFQLILLFFAIASNKSTTQLISFHLYLLAIIFVLSTNKEYVQFACFGKVLFWISGFIAFVVLFQATNGFVQLSLSFDNTGKLWLDQGGDPITMSRALELNFIACLYYKEKNKLEKIATLIFIVADIVGILSFSNRSVTACTIIVFFIWCRENLGRRIDIKKAVTIIVAVTVIAFLGTRVTYFSDKIDSMYMAMTSGLKTLLGFDTAVFDPSAATRVRILADINKEFGNNFVKNFLMGLGYNYTYVDRPIYQIFFDLGILGLILYMYFLLFIPLKILLKQLNRRENYNGAWEIIVYSTIQILVDQFLTGLPYYYYLWTPTIFILFTLSNCGCIIKDNGNLQTLKL